MYNILKYLALFLLLLVLFVGLIVHVVAEQNVEQSYYQSDESINQVAPLDPIKLDSHE